MVRRPRALETILFVPDTHSPYHDARAFDLVDRVARAIKPHTTVIMGDFADFYAVSSHGKDPALRMTFDQEIAVTNKLLRRVEGWGSKRKLYLMGNHEDRLDRYIQDTAPEMHGIVEVDELLKLSAHGWKVTAYKDHTNIGKVYLTHDLGKAGMNAVRDASASFQDNIVIGHLHRLLYQVDGNVKGKAHVAACFGWLGDALRCNYMFRIKAMREWALGFGVGYMTHTGVVHLQPVPIVNYTCVVQGELFHA